MVALEQGYKNMSYKIDDMPDQMKKALEVVNNRTLFPASRATRLQELGYETPGDACICSRGQAIIII